MVQLSPRLQARLARVPDIAREAAAAEMEAAAADIVAEMKRVVRVDSGDLRDSIGWTWGDVPAGSFVIADIRSGKNKGEQYATLRIRIYAGNREAFHGRFVEHGTRRMPAHPFFYPTWKERRTEFKARVRAAVQRRLRDEWGNP